MNRINAFSGWRQASRFTIIVCSALFIHLYILYYCILSVALYDVRFSTEDVSVHSPEHKPKPSARAARPRSDWLGLKQDEEEQKTKEEPKQSAPETLKPPASPSTAARKETPALNTADPPGAPSSPKTLSKPVKRDEDEEDDWLAGALSRKKTQSVSQSEDRERKQEVSSGEEVDVLVR